MIQGYSDNQGSVAISSERVKMLLWCLLMHLNQTKLHILIILPVSKYNFLSMWLPSMYIHIYCMNAHSVIVITTFQLVNYANV